MVVMVLVSGCRRGNKLRGNESDSRLPPRNPITGPKWIRVTFGGKVWQEPEKVLFRCSQMNWRFVCVFRKASPHDKGNHKKAVAGLGTL